MAKDMGASQHIGTQGWEQFLTARREMLDAFDNAKKKDKAHKVPAYRGHVAEAEFRKWLTTFLPKKYGVTSGFIVSQGLSEGVKTPHYDVIIYNQLESPVLWVEGSADSSSAGSSRAIPAEYVQAVIEVKSSYDAPNAGKALKHLFELEPLLREVDPAGERYKKYLPANFFCAVIYFEDSGQNRYKRSTQSKAVPHRPLRGFFGGMILRANDSPADEALRMYLLVSKARYRPASPERTYLAEISEAPMANHHTEANGYQIGGLLHQGEAAFSIFAFDLLALLNGTYEPGRVSSYHCISGTVGGKEGGQ